MTDVKNLSPEKIAELDVVFARRIAKADRSVVSALVAMLRRQAELWSVVAGTEVPSEIIAALKEFNELSGRTGRAIIGVTGLDAVVGVSPEGFKARFVDAESGLTLDYSAQAKQSVEEKSVEANELQTEVVNGIEFTKAKPFQGMKRWSARCKVCGETKRVTKGTVDVVRDGTIGRYRLATMKTQPPWDGWVCADCDAEARRREVDEKEKESVKRAVEARRAKTKVEPRGGPIYMGPMPPEIGTLDWYGTEPHWDQRGVVHSILRLLEQQAITRTKAVELLRYATEVGWQGSTMSPPPAPWADLNWCSDDHDDGETIPEIDGSWVCAMCGKTQAEHELILIPAYPSSPKIRACVSMCGYGIAYVPRAEYEKRQEVLGREGRGGE